ncbi:MAG: nucleotidyltransferase domain-containing protein [Chthoniobacterales bacterium]
MQQPDHTLDESVLQAVAARIGQEAAVSAAYLLGSAADGRLRAESDVDLALLPVRGASIGGLARVELAADLELLLGRPVDLGVLHTGNLVYAKEAVAHGRLLFERDQNARAGFAALVFSMYADLQENRREVIDGYAA